MKKTNLLILLAVACASAGFAVRQLSDPDIWWHLAEVRNFLRHGLPSTNTFSHTFPDHPWVYHYWLFGLVMQGFMALGGLAGLQVLQMVFVALTLAVTFDTVRIQTGRLRPTIVFPLLFLALTAIWQRIAPRPHLANFLGLALLVNLWHRRPQRLWIWYGLLAILWANCHPGVIYGVGAIAAMLAASLLAGRKEDFVRGSLGGAAFVAGSMINPQGPLLYAYPFWHLNVERFLPIGSYRHAMLQVDRPFFLLAALAVAAALFFVWKRQFLHPLLCGLFLPFALYAIRMIPNFVVVTLPAAAVAADRFMAGGRGSRWRRLSAVLVPLLLAVGAGYLTFDHFRRIDPLIDGYGWGVLRETVPEGGSQYVESRGLEGRMYNDYGDGGYLAWRLYPRQRVFVDGRAPAYPTSFLNAVLRSMNPSAWRSFMDTYQVDFAIVKRRPFGSQIDMSPFFTGIGWPMVYLDGRSYVFVRPESADMAKVRQDVFSLIAPNDGVEVMKARARSDPERMRAELRRIDPARLLVIQDFYRFGIAAQIAGDLSLSESVFRHGLERYGEDAILHYNLGMILADTGRGEEARSEFAEARRTAQPGQVKERAERMLEELGGEPVRGK